MEAYRARCTIDNIGNIKLEKKIALPKGPAELIILPIEMEQTDDCTKGIAFSDHHLGKVTLETLRREDIYGENGR